MCFTCAKADNLGSLTFCQNKEPAFITDGFDNWKKGKEKLKKHESTDTHCFAVYQMSTREQRPITAQLSAAKEKQQASARRCLMKIFTTAKFLLRQGLAFRGHEQEEGNFNQLLRLKMEDDPELHSYMVNTITFSSPQAQEEVMKMYCHAVLRKLAADIIKNKFFSVIVDGTQDINGVEQESICLRHVDSDLNAHETFLGLYKTSATDGQAIASIVSDELQRFSLSIDKLRGQTYDGAANMSGKYSGCQAVVKNLQPLALFFLCFAHVSNLIMKHAVLECFAIRNAIQWVHELRVLYQRSGKFKVSF